MNNPVQLSFRTSRIGIKRPRNYVYAALLPASLYTPVVTLTYLPWLGNSAYSFSTTTAVMNPRGDGTGNDGRMEHILRNLAYKNTQKFEPRTASQSSSRASVPSFAPSPASSASSSSPLRNLLQENNSVHPSFITTVLLTYMNSRTNDKVKPDLLTLSLVLARIAAIDKPSTSDMLLHRNAAFVTLLQDLEIHLRIHPSSTPTTTNDSPSLLLQDGRLLVSIFHSLTKLRNILHSSMDLYNFTSLKQTLFSLIQLRLSILNPRSVAMIAWSFSKWTELRNDRSLFTKLSELSVTGVCAKAPTKVPPSIAVSLRHKNRRPNRMDNEHSSSSSVPAAYTSPFESQELVMLLTAFYTSGVLYESSVVLQRLRAYILATLPYFSHANLGTVISLLSLSSRNVRKQKNSTNITETSKAIKPSYDEFLQLLFVCADEVTVRLTILTRESSPSSSSSSSLSDSTASKDYGNAIANMERRQLAAIEAMRSSDSIFHDIPGKVENLHPSMVQEFPERYQPIPGTVLANVLHSLSSATLRVPHLLGATARYLASSSSSVSGVRPIEILDNEALANIAWSFATARYDSPSTAIMWKSLVKTVTNRVRTDDSFGTPHNIKNISKGGSYLTSSQIASCAWASTVASIPAESYFMKILRHIQYHVVEYSLPALAQIVWACSIQNVFHYEAMHNIYEHILALSEKDQQNTVAPPSVPKPRTPDETARYLLVPADTVPNEVRKNVRKLQAQLYTGLLGLQLHSVGGVQEVTKGMDKIRKLFTTETITLWKEALYANEVHVSKLQTDVSRVLSTARIPHAQEYASPEGLICDVLINDPNVIKQCTIVPVRNFRPIQGIVIEVQGPSHFTCGIDIMQNLVRDAAGSVKFHPSDMLMKPSTVTGNDNDAIMNLGSTTVIPSSLLVPTLRTRAKQRWLEQLGYIVVNINFIEWNNVPSTEEKMELLYDKGIPIPKKLLSWG